MRVEHGLWSSAQSLQKNELQLQNDAQLVLYFGAKALVENGSAYNMLKEIYPQATIAGCSTGGEIFDREFNEESCVFTAIHLEKSEVKAESTKIQSREHSHEVGKTLASKLNQKDNLRAVFLISEGLDVNGSELVQGVNDVVDTEKVVVTGGLAGDADRFEETLVGCNAAPESHQVIAIGFYGDDLDIQWGSDGGWEIFGPERTITKSEGNVLYEVDGKPALDLYKRYLGDEAKNLPASGLYFPLAIWKKGTNSEAAVIRTLLSINEEEKSMLFTGDVPQGWSSQLMWGKFDNIVDGAVNASQSAMVEDLQNSLSILISCLGRKALMGQRIVDEIEQSANVLGAQNKRVGFYSYGEIAPHQISKIPVLHNQTMTITTISERK